MYPPAERWKRRIWEAARKARGETVEKTPLADLDTQGRAQFYDGGSEFFAAMAERIRTETGFSLDGCRALDYGCGVGRVALALARQAEHVYGLDVSAAALHEADVTARERNVSNVEWMDIDQLSRLAGQYDVVVSFYVFQHIRRRAGEQTFQTLLKGLRPGGVGAMQFMLESPPVSRFSREYVYTLGKTYSLNRLGKLLADQDVREWHANFSPHTSWDQGGRYYDATIVFRKP